VEVIIDWVLELAQVVREASWQLQPADSPDRAGNTWTVRLGVTWEHMDRHLAQLATFKVGINLHQLLKDDLIK